MKRLHLFEFEDLPWFPKSIRNYGTDFLQFVSNKFNLYKSIHDLLKKGLEKSGGTQVIDLASGGGGGWLRLSNELKEEVPNLKVKLTDFYPNIPAFERTLKLGDEGIFSYESNSVNALDVPKNLSGFRTQFLSFHHFKPDDAKQILQNAVDAGAPIGVFEVQERKVPDVIRNLFSPLSVIFMTPFIRPFSLGRIVFTYLIPIVPLFVLWDGVVSVLRTYNIPDLEKMTRELDRGDSYEWEIGKAKNGPSFVLYLLGYPKNAP